MPLTPINLSNKAKKSPPPIHDSVVANGRATEIFIRFLLDLRASGGNVYDEINRVITQVNLNKKAIFDETRELITTASISTSIIAKSQTVICDATSGAINITLPDPTLCYGNNRSFRIAIYKKDTTVNEVTILPFGTETIVGEVSQILNSEGDVINLITDGINWILGA